MTDEAEAIMFAYDVLMIRELVGLRPKKVIGLQCLLYGSFEEKGAVRRAPDLFDQLWIRHDYEPPIVYGNAE